MSLAARPAAPAPIPIAPRDPTAKEAIMPDTPPTIEPETDEGVEAAGRGAEGAERPRAERPQGAGWFVVVACPACPQCQMPLGQRDDGTVACWYCQPGHRPDQDPVPPARRRRILASFTGPALARRPIGFRLRACPRCGGALVPDPDGERTCAFGCGWAGPVRPPTPEEAVGEVHDDGPDRAATVPAAVADAEVLAVLAEAGGAELDNRAVAARCGLRRDQVAHAARRLLARDAIAGRIVVGSPTGQCGGPPSRLRVWSAKGGA